MVKRREEYRHWGKDKTAVLLKEQGSRVSTSLAGRTVRRLKDRGVLEEPVRNRLSSNKKAHSRHYAIRKPEDYHEVKAPFRCGD